MKGCDVALRCPSVNTQPAEDNSKVKLDSFNMETLARNQFFFSNHPDFNTALVTLIFLVSCVSVVGVCSLVIAMSLRQSSRGSQQYLGLQLI